MSNLTPEQTTAFVNLTKAVRLWQKEFFATRRSEALKDRNKWAFHKSKSLEKELDKFLADLENTGEAPCNWHIYLYITSYDLPPTQ